MAKVVEIPAEGEVERIKREITDHALARAAANEEKRKEADKKKFDPETADVFSGAVLRRTYRGTLLTVDESWGTSFMLSFQVSDEGTIFDVLVTPSVGAVFKARQEEGVVEYVLSQKAGGQMRIELDADSEVPA